MSAYSKDPGRFGAPAAFSDPESFGNPIPSAGVTPPQRVFEVVSPQQENARKLLQMLKKPLIGLTLLLLAIIMIASTRHIHASSPGGDVQYMKVEAAELAKVNWKEVKEDILAIISEGDEISDRGPTVVRLAWHLSGTYDKERGDGGSNGGTIRFKEELAHGANAGLNLPVKWLEKVHRRHKPITYADLYTYAGVVAIEAMGGPKIQFRAGRQDAKSPDAVTPDGRLPDADKGAPHATAEGLRNTFYRMGFDDQEIVALSGAHALGRCHKENSGYVGPWQEHPTHFSNVYFKELMDVKWSPDSTKDKFQYTDPSGEIMMLPSDMVLVQDSKFKKWVEVYASDKDQFYEDFAKAFQKLEENGCDELIDIPADDA